MFVENVKNMPKIDMTAGGAVNTKKQIAVGPEQGWEDYVMRIMTVGIGGSSPEHAHNWPHINYVISGVGTLVMDGEVHLLETGACAYIPSNVLHCFRNTGEVPLEFICIVPTEGEA